MNLDRLPSSSKFYNEIIVKHDNIKNEYCKNKNIDLLRIPYYNYRTIENILEVYIENIKNT